MIVLCAGMQKAGSGWYFNLANDLMVAAGHQDVRAVRQKYRLEKVLRHYNCNIDEPSGRKLARVTVPHLLGNSFVIKSHSGPTGWMQPMIRAGILRPTYIYRDPRDAALSAFEHGQKIRSQGESHSFARLDTVEAAFKSARQWLVIWQQWAQCKQALLVRYEDLLANPAGELGRLATFLSLHVPDSALGRIAAAYQPEALEEQPPKGLHFNKGLAGRYREVFSPAELALSQSYFGDYLQEMGYAE